MATIQDIKNKINTLIVSGNEKAGTEFTTLSETVNNLIEGYGSGGGIEVNGKLWNMVLNKDYTCLSASNYGEVETNIANLEPEALTVYGISKLSLNEATSIPDNFAKDNKQLLKIFAPKVTAVGNYAFNGCENLIKITLSDDLSTIGSYAFYGVPIKAMNLENVTSLGTYSFSEGELLTEVNIPKIEVIESNTFSRSGLTKIIAPIVKTIKGYAFNNCYLRVGYFPSLTAIEGNSVFAYSSSKPVNIILPGETLATINSSNCFGYGSPSTSSHPDIWVNDNLVDSYKAATNWSKFANYIYPVSTLPEEIKAEIGME